MNPDNPQSPREQLETRLTALLLGELSADEAAELHAAILNDVLGDGEVAGEALGVTQQGRLESGKELLQGLAPGRPGLIWFHQCHARRIIMLNALFLQVIPASGSQENIGLCLYDT